MIDAKTKSLLLIILDHCKRILEKTEQITIEDFYSNNDIQEIVCFNLLQIGELAKRFDKTVLEKYNNVDWINIKGLRDRIVHGYGTIDLETILKISTDDVPVLFNYCNEILNQKTE